jgi:protease I
MKALIISANRFEDSELLVPWYRLREEGITVDIASLTRGLIKGKHDYEIDANVAIAEVHPDQYGALLLPGGKAPSALRENKRVLDVVRAFSRPTSPSPPSATGRRFCFPPACSRAERRPVTGRWRKNSGTPV